MQRVIVTVKRKDEARVRDLEVPTDVEAGRLAEMVARALHWESDAAGQPVHYQIEAHPLGRVLQVHESLASAGVWDGSWLVFFSEGRYPQVGDRTPGVSYQSPDQAQSSAGPVTGWRSLGIDLPDGAGQAPVPEEKPASGYVWKQVD